MFDRTCPTYCKNRWHFAFEVLHWISSRESLLQYLGPESVKVGDDITAAEVEALKELHSSEHRHRFWAIFWVYYILQSWGFEVRTFMHSCPCPHHQNLTFEERKREFKQSPCKMNGRRMIDLACGACSKMYSKLRQLRLQDHKKAYDALNFLAGIEPDLAQRVESSFMSAKNAMLLRFWQGTSFYEQYPWNIPKLLAFLLVPAEDRSDAILASQTFAGELIQSFSEGRLQTGRFADKFFGDGFNFKHAVTAWSSGGSTAVMDTDLFRELLSYSLALVVMQRLESRHHLVNQKLSSSRASSAAYVSANLRRRLNNDAAEPTFRENFEMYLQKFDELVPEQWQTKCELHRLVSGHTLSLMFADVSVENAIIAAQSIPARPRDDLALKFQEHLQLALTEGDYYALPMDTSNGATTYLLCQIVCVRPEGKRYMQRAVGWNVEQHWLDQVAVLVMGTTCIQSAVVDCEEDADTSLVSLPDDFSQEVQAGNIQAFPMQAFFKFQFDNVYRLSAQHLCKLSTDTLLSSLDDDCMLDTVDVTTLFFGMAVATAYCVFTWHLPFSWVAFGFETLAENW